MYSPIRGRPYSVGISLRAPMGVDREIIHGFLTIQKDGCAPPGENIYALFPMTIYKIFCAWTSRMKHHRVAWQKQRCSITKANHYSYFCP